MPRNRDQSPAGRFLAGQTNAAKDLLRLPIHGARDLPIVRGIGRDCSTEKHLDSVLGEITELLVRSGRVFTYEDSVVMEFSDPAGEKYLRVLMSEGQVHCHAGDLLGNIFLCSPKLTSVETDIPSKQIASAVFHREPTIAALPRILRYARMPVFDEDFRFCGPGWNPASGTLVHGPEVPCELPTGVLHEPGASGLERLPRHLRALLSGFCFASDADLANAVGVLLTGLLISHHIETSHPLVLLDGNRPGVGKTLFVRTVGMLLDGCEPIAMTFTTDGEELEKRIGAGIRQSKSRCFLFDNARVQVGQVIGNDSLESKSIMPIITTRILGRSENISRPNDMLWFLTMNDTKTNLDVLSRSLAIRFRCDGNPAEREFSFDPVEYARTHRIEILAELVSMVLVWRQHGADSKARKHRLPIWARMIGGILDHNGQTEFLNNQQACEEEFRDDTDELVSIAEECLTRFIGGQDTAEDYCVFRDPQDSSAEVAEPKGLPPGEWKPIFLAADVEKERLQSNKKKTGPGKIIGQFFKSRSGCKVTASYGDHKYAATLRVVPGRSNQTNYFFEFEGTTPLRRSKAEPSSACPSATSIGELLIGPQPKATAQSLLTSAPKTKVSVR